MKPINNYILEARDRQAGGRFKNSGSYVDPNEIREFASKHIVKFNNYYVPGGMSISPVGGDIVVGGEDGSLPRIDLNAARARAMDVIGFECNKWTADEKDLNLLNVLDVDGLLDVINIDYVKWPFADLQNLSLAFPMITNEINIEDSGIDNINGMPVFHPTKSVRGMRKITLKDNPIRSIAGCPDCDMLDLRDTNVTSLAGTNIKELKTLNVCGCHIKDFNGAPMLASRGVSLNICGNPVDMSGFGRICAKVKSWDELSLDATQFKVMDKRIFDKAKINKLSIWFGSRDDVDGFADAVKSLKCNVNCLYLESYGFPGAHLARKELAACTQDPDNAFYDVSVLPNCKSVKNRI